MKLDYDTWKMNNPDAEASDAIPRSQYNAAMLAAEQLDAISLDELPVELRAAIVTCRVIIDKWCDDAEDHGVEPEMGGCDE